MPLSPGLEAEVVKIELYNKSFVLKLWNKDSKPNVGNQYKLLYSLYEKGVRVSKPYGWGVDADDNQVLLTSYDGQPISKINKAKLKKLARMLVQVHQYRMDKTDLTFIPRYDFFHYFFPAIELHHDINHLLTNLMNMVDISQDSLIHGDYNLGNILEERDNYTIIDWTNGQLGDPRYDIAWSVFLINIYTGERYGGIYQSDFLGLSGYSLEDSVLFEAIACLRWILLSRITNLPKDPSVLKRVKKIIFDNRYLNINI